MYVCMYVCMYGFASPRVTLRPHYFCFPTVRVLPRISIGAGTNEMKKLDGPSRSWPAPHTTPLFLPPRKPLTVEFERCSCIYRS